MYRICFLPIILVSLAFGQVKPGDVVLLQGRKSIARAKVLQVRGEKCRVMLTDFNKETTVPAGDILKFDSKAFVFAGNRVVVFLKGSRSGYWYTVIKKQKSFFRVRSSSGKLAWVTRKRIYVPIVELRGISITARDDRGKQARVKLYHKMHAVIIGIDRYVNLDESLQLKYAVSDAKAVEKVLRERYTFDKIVTLYNEQASKENIQKVLLGDMSKISKEDAVLVFFAGHGYTEKTNFGSQLGYLLPYDGSFEQSDMYRNLSMNQIKDDISLRIPAKHVFYIMDCCYGGLLTTTRSGGERPKKSLEDMRENTKEKVRQVLTAGSDKEQVLDGGPLGHSVFTGRLVQALQNNKDFITAMELSLNIRDRVRQDARARGHDQNPQYGRLFGMGDFVLIADTEAHLRKKLAAERQKSRALQKEENKVRQGLERIEAELSAIKRRVETAQSEWEKREAELRQKEIEAHKWREQQKKSELERQVALQKKAEAEAQKLLQEEEKLQSELERLTLLEKQRRENKMREQEQARIATQHKLEAMGKEAQQKRRELEKLLTRRMGLKQAKSEVLRLKKKLAEIDNKYDRELREAIAALDQSYVSTETQTRKQIAHYQNLLRKSRQITEHKRSELLAEVREEKDMFETAAEHIRRVKREKAQAIEAANHFAANQGLKAKKIEGKWKEYRYKLKRLAIEKKSEKKHLEARYSEQKQNWQKFYRKHITKILDKIYRVKVDSIKLEKYNAETETFQGHFYSDATVELTGKKNNLEFQLERAIARKWYRGQKHLRAELLVKLELDLETQVTGLEIRYLAGNDDSTDRVIAEVINEELRRKRQLARERELARKRQLEREQAIARELAQLKLTGFRYLREQTYSCGGQSYTVKEFLHEKTGMEFALIPGGFFNMGSSDGESDEKPVHRVEISSFLLAKTEVSQGVWKKIMGTEPWKRKSYVKEGDDYAASYVSWQEAQEFCKKAGLSLPSEAEWEYACRSGSATKYYWGNDMHGAYAWFDDNADSKGESYAHKVKQKKPNAFGLYDMSGNVWEWCRDWYDQNYYKNSPKKNPAGPANGSRRVIRGGSRFDLSGYCRSAYRYINWPGYRNYDVGFRPSGLK